MSNDERSHIAYTVNRLFHEIADLHLLKSNPRQREYLKMEVPDLERAFSYLGDLILGLKMPSTVDLNHFMAAE